MRGAVARKLRKEVYGEQSSAANARSYFINEKKGVVIADALRRAYQNAKRRHRGSVQ